MELSPNINEIKNLIPLIVLNWNGENDTISCLKSIRNSDNSGFLTILVDNGSKKESLVVLKKESEFIYSNVLYINREHLTESSTSIIDFISKNSFLDSLIFIENNENLGFAKGNNIGIEIAKLIDCKWVMLLNNDTEIEHNSLSNLNDFIQEHPEIKAVTPEIRYFYQKEKIWNCGGKLTFFGSRKYLFAEQTIISRPEIGFSSISFITGCALLFQYKETGILTEDFFFGEEDYEFSMRMKKNKKKMACVHSSVIYHKVGSSIKKRADTTSSIYLYYINRLINTRNYYSQSRWQITKILAYLYLIILLQKYNQKLSDSLSLIKKINDYVSNNRTVNFVEFQKAMNKC